MKNEIKVAVVSSILSAVIIWLVASNFYNIKNEHLDSISKNLSNDSDFIEQIVKAIKNDDVLQGINQNVESIKKINNKISNTTLNNLLITTNDVCPPGYSFVKSVQSGKKFHTNSGGASVPSTYLCIRRSK